MKLTIDNQDGKGPVDYSAAVVAGAPVAIERRLNEPSLCSIRLAGCGSTIAMPARNGRMVVSDDSGVHLFTGYLAVEPAFVYMGVGLAGAVSETVVQAISDEVMLDRLTLPQTIATAGQAAAAAFGALAARVGANGVAMDPQFATWTVGCFEPDAGRSWSENAGELASTVRGVYRSTDGVVSLTSVGGTVHPLNESDGSLQVHGLTAKMAAMPANDITVCGAVEPAAYVTEIFQGDGTTSEFDLKEQPFFPTASKSKPLEDLFNGPQVNPLLWSVTDPTSRISLTSNGLTFASGGGSPTAAAVASIDQIELGGSVVAEAAGVQLGTTGDGIVCGFFSGGSLINQCFAGFRARPASSGTVLVAVIAGAEAGAVFTPAPGRVYTLRARLYCAEPIRVLQRYACRAGSGQTSFGGDQPTSPMNLVLEVQDVTNGANGVATVLYDGATGFGPAACTFMPVSSISLSGSIASISVTLGGSVWVTVQTGTNAPATQREGTAAQGAQYSLVRSGKVSFLPGCVPAAGTTITAFYRTSTRAVARLANAQSVAAEAAAGVPGAARWAGSVSSPAARCSADCENAARALLTFSCDRNSAWAGSYTGYNLEQQSDVWPGDVLAVASASAGVNATLIVRTVKIEIEPSASQLTKYTIGFSNDWADSLSMKLSTSVPKDVWLPASAETVAPLNNLASLTASVSTSAIAVQANTAPPTGGGFEVRRKDWAFRPGNDADLVLRSPVANFSIPRLAAQEQYYIRMYDGSTPPVYSRFSSGVFVNAAM